MCGHTWLAIWPSNLYQFTFWPPKNWLDVTTLHPRQNTFDMNPSVHIQIVGPDPQSDSFKSGTEFPLENRCWNWAVCFIIVIWRGVCIINELMMVLSKIIIKFLEFLSLSTLLWWKLIMFILEFKPSSSWFNHNVAATDSSIY